MKSFGSRLLTRGFSTLSPLFAFALLCALPGSARGQIYETNYAGDTIGDYNLDGTPIGSGTLESLGNFDDPTGLAVSGTDIFVVNAGVSTIGEFNVNTGAPINGGTFASASGLGSAQGMLVSGSEIFVADHDDGYILDFFFDPATGALVSSGTLVSSGLAAPWGFALSGSTLYVTDSTLGTIQEYNASTGAPINTGTLFTGLSTPTGLAVSGTDIYVANYGSSTIGEYTTTGGTVSATLIASGSAGLSSPGEIAISGTDLYVANYGGDAVLEFNATSGSAINTGTLISGLDQPYGIVVIPEPSACAFLGAGACVVFSSVLLRRRRDGRRTKAPQMPSLPA